MIQTKKRKKIYLDQILFPGQEKMAKLEAEHKKKKNKPKLSKEEKELRKQGFYSSKKEAEGSAERDFIKDEKRARKEEKKAMKEAGYYYDDSNDFNLSGMYDEPSILKHFK